MQEKLNLPQEFYLANNICDLLKDEKIDSIGQSLLQQITDDINSRSDWLEANDKWMELVTQVLQKKTYPWVDASNIKFPLIATASVQFHARAYPALLGTNKPVKVRTIGRDPQGLKQQRAGRVGTYLSYQVTDYMEDWVEDMDRLLFILPIIGSLYKKTYFDEAKGQTVSELIHPRDFIINYDAKNIKDARKTHRLWLMPNTVKSMQLRGLYRDIPDEEEFPAQAPKVSSEVGDKIQGKQNPGKVDDFALQEFYEVHCLLDLDEDGYKEPYIVTLRQQDGKVYRIVANYDENNMEYIDETLVEVTPKDYFTHYMFLPDPESKTHGMGFGTMIGPMNEAVNSLINILMDAGHLHSLGGGFLSRGVRIQGGAVKFRPSEWKVVNSTGDDLRKGVFPLPTKEPSMVLFQLLGLLIEAGKDLSSVQDQMVGRSPGQNQPYATTEAVMEQGMKVFNGIYKRIYRALSKEFKKIYNLTREHPDLDLYMNVLDLDGQEATAAAQMPDLATQQPMGEEKVMQFLASDFNFSDHDIQPTAEPDMISEMEKIMKARSLEQKRAQGFPLNVEAILRRSLEAEGHENIDELMNVPPPQLPPDVQLEQAKFKWQMKMDTLTAEREDIMARAQASKNKFEGMLALAKAQGESVANLHSMWIEEQEQFRKEFDSVTARMKAISDGQNKQEGKQAEGASGASNSG